MVTFKVQLPTLFGKKELGIICLTNFQDTGYWKIMLFKLVYQQPRFDIFVGTYNEQHENCTINLWYMTQTCDKGQVTQTCATWQVSSDTHIVSKVPVPSPNSSGVMISCDTWHVTHDQGHRTGDTEVVLNILGRGGVVRPTTNYFVIFILGSGTAIPRCDRQYSIPLDQKQRRAYNSSLHWDEFTQIFTVAQW